MTTLSKLNKLKPAQDYALTIAKAALSSELTRFLGVLEKAISIEPLPCSTKLYGDKYRLAASDMQWLAITFIKDAEMAAATSKLLWSLAADANGDDENMLLKFHAIEKSAEATSILDLFNLTFEGAIDPGLRQQLQELVPNYSIEKSFELSEDLNFKLNVSMFDYLHINLTSLRSMMLLSLQSSGISQHCLPGNRRKATALSNSILAKRMRLFDTTAKLINEQMNDTDQKKHVALFSTCLAKINRETSEESIDFIYHSRFGNYP